MTTSAFTKLSTGLAILLVAAFAAAGCGDDEVETATFETPTYPFSFDYPDGWKVTRNPTFVFGSDEAVRSIGVSLEQPHDQVTITQYKLSEELPEGFNANQDEIDRIVRRLTRQADGTASDSKAVSYGGIPGYQYVVEYPAADGTELRTTMTFLFRGEDEFLVNCQSSPANREALEAGCNQVLDSLKFS